MNEAEIRKMLEDQEKKKHPIPDEEKKVSEDFQKRVDELHKQTEEDEGDFPPDDLLRKSLGV